MISPTGQGIRNDPMGLGDYGTPRTKGRLHMGVDFLCTPHLDVVAPFDMFIVRVARPKADSAMSGISWRTKHMSGQMFYFLPLRSLIGKRVKQGDVIGVAQDVSKEYNGEMKPHIHFEIESFDPMVLMGLMEVVRLSGA